MSRPMVFEGEDGFFYHVAGSETLGWAVYKSVFREPIDGGGTIAWDMYLTGIIPRRSVAQDYAEACAEGRRPKGNPPGSRRPKNEPVSIRMTPARRARFKELGGLKWLYSVLDGGNVSL